jgi:transcriptional regulator with XRE-family HTH domain
MRAIGATLRDARQRRNWGLRQLAARVGVSPSLVSQVERGQIAPSVSTLYLITSELGLTIDALFSAARYAERSSPSRELDNLVQFGRGRKHIQLAGGVRWERLTPVAEQDCEFLFVVYAVSAESCPAGEFVRHNGKEFAYLVRGRLGITIGAERCELCAGDSIAFDARIPHRLWTIGHVPAEAVWVVLNRDQPSADQALDAGVEMPPSMADRLSKPIGRAACRPAASDKGCTPAFKPASICRCTCWSCTKTMRP